MSNKGLDDQKLELEVRALRRSLRTEWLKILLSVLGALAFLFAFLLDRAATREQRLWERKTEVVRQFDDLYGSTLATLQRVQANATFLNSHLEALEEKLDELERIGRAQANGNEARDLVNFAVDGRALAERISAELVNTKEVDRWAAGARLQEEWLRRENAPSPDFEELFGEELQEKWKPVYDAATSALSSEFSLLGDTVDTKNLRDAGDEFRRELYAALAR